MRTLMSSYSLLAKSFYALPAATNAATDVVSQGLLVRTDTAKKETANGITRLNKASIDTTATGVKVTHTFKLRMPENFIFGGTVRVRAKWRVNASSPAGAKGRLNLEVRKNTVAIAGAAVFNGSERALDAAPGTQYTETWLAVHLPAGTTFTAGQTLDVQVQFEVTTAAAGATFELGLHCDPATSGDELVVEIDTGAS